MQVYCFHLMPWAHLPEDFAQLMQTVTDFASARSASASPDRVGLPASIEVILHVEPQHAEARALGGAGIKRYSHGLNRPATLKLTREFYAKSNIVNFPMGNTGAQMGGFFRKEVKSLADMKGLKFRVGGFGGKIIERIGGVPQNIPGGEIYAALEKGTIDAAEWVGPYDDQKLGFNKIAPYYYYPGWWEGGPQTSAYVNLTKWNELPKAYQTVIQNAAARAQALMLSKYDAENPKALRELMAAGTKLLPFPQSVMEAAFNASNELYAELSAKNPKFKKVYENWKPFRNEEILWFRVCEGSFDNFMARMSAANKL